MDIKEFVNNKNITDDEIKAFYFRLVGYLGEGLKYTDNDSTRQEVETMNGIIKVLTND